MPSASKIFTGYRALGFVSNHVPLAVRYHHKHKENYVVTCVGTSFHTYNCSKLGIVSVSDAHPDEIGVIAVDRDLVFTGCRNVVRAYTRGKQVVYTYEGHDKDVHLLLPFGPHLVSVDTTSRLIVWDIESEGQYLEMTFSNATFEITTVTHPSTYVNKILLGSHHGELQLWNIKQNMLVYTFYGWGAAVTAVQQAPAVDVVAIGLASGQIILHNLRFDETITKFLQDWGPVTTISFRTDGHPIMATGSAAGHIALWDLEERKLSSQMRGAHTTSVSGMQCLPNEPLMVTSAADNSLKVWIFDMPDGGGRLLRERSGHSGPPNKLRHYDNNGHIILSAGQDGTMRSFSTVHDRHNKSMGRASYDKAKTKKNTLKHDQYRMPYVTDFVAEASRQSDWDNILACHRGLPLVTTWSCQRSTMGKHKFQHERFVQEAQTHRTTVAQCVEITSCGNFGLIGYSSGHVDVYNMQSGIYRGSYGQPTAHDSPVEGVAVDGLNQVTVTAGRHGDIKFWRFKQKEQLDNIKLDTCVARLLLHRESSMLAVAQDDFVISVVDMDTRRLVRKFTGHNNRITDMTYSADSRWLITASMDCTIRVWDMPTGRLIDCFLVDKAVTSLTMSPTSDFLSTSHLDDVGVYLWSNMTLFAHVPLRALPADFEPSVLEMPSTQRKIADDQEEQDEAEFVTSTFKSTEQISDELVTLSLLPHSRWQNLLSLDVIKQRNKPKEPPKAPKAAPFFLPTIPGLEPKFAPVEEPGQNKSKSKFLGGSVMPLSTMAKLLQDPPTQQPYADILEHMKSLGPSAIDLEIRSLAPDGGGSEEIMCKFLKFVHVTMETKKNFEILQAYLGLFLKLHGDLVSSCPDIVAELETISRVQAATWINVQNLLNQTMCLVNYMRTATL